MIWPNTKVNVMPGAPNLSIGPLVPAAPGATEGYLDYFFPGTPTPPGSPATSSSTTRSARRTGCWSSRCSAGCGRARFERGRLMMPSEELIADFQRWVAAGLG